MDENWENEGGMVYAPRNEHHCPYEEGCCIACSYLDEDRAKARERGWCCNHRIVPNG